jgi:glycosyltransferase involved in cell wall biosynthesis
MMDNTRSPLVSVVTPVYNCEKYIRECIESVRSQTYENWDYTIVNNCSTDSTLAIAREYAERDSRIRVIDNTDFLRVFANFNKALRHISPASKYAKVLAADDRMYPECLEKMVTLAEKHPRVAIVNSCWLTGVHVRPERLPSHEPVVSGRELCRGWLLDPSYYPYGTPSNVLYRSDIVRSREMFYNESNFHADFEVCLEFLETYDFGFVPQVLTFARERDDPTMTSFSVRTNTYISARMYEIDTYGPRYLTEFEMTRRVRQIKREYYRYLAKQLYNRRDKAFWDYHKNKLLALGHPLEWTRLSAFALVEGLVFLFQPKRIIRRLSGSTVG